MGQVDYHWDQGRWALKYHPTMEPNFPWKVQEQEHQVPEQVGRGLEALSRQLPNKRYFQ
jgi:hypothetical protein